MSKFQIDNLKIKETASKLKKRYISPNAQKERNIEKANVRAKISLIELEHQISANVPVLFFSFFFYNWYVFIQYIFIQ